MQKFLAKTAAYIHEKHPQNLDKIAIVLPNQRANLFLKKHFSNLISKAIWSPKFASIEDFIVDISELQMIDNIDLLFELYAVHKELQPTDHESIEDFATWGNIMLYDFNELDRYLVDADSLYKLLSEVHAMEVWNVDGKEITEFQKNYLSFWAKLGEYYTLLKQRLLEDKKAYQGMAYRRAAEKITTDYVINENFEKIYFVGFNAFTRAEEKILKTFVEAGKAEMLWDADEYYIHDENQEAGDFLRPRWKENKEHFKWLSHDLLTSNKELNITAVSGNIAQVKLAANLLENIPTEELSDTAIVLAEEKLLLPMLQSFPENIKKANITMGLPLNSTPVYRFFNDYFQLFLNMERLNAEKKEVAFYYKDFLRVLENPLVQKLSSNELKDISVQINQQKLFFINTKVLSGFSLSEELKTLFDFDNLDTEHFINSLLFSIDSFKGKEKVDALEQEYLYQFLKIFNRLKDLLKNNSDFDINLKALYNLFTQISSSYSVPFYGEPLQGLQIMGVLESRTLDFKNIMILSVNEGTLPSGKSQNSFIPYDFKRKFGLPSYKEKDSIFAYHFYRLMQRAEKINLVYNTQTDALNGNEESRFIKQLLQEMPTKNKNVKITEQSLSIPIAKNETESIVIQKNEEIISIIKDHLSYGISPSALSTFIRCPLDYYYKYVLKLKTKEEAQEVLESHTFGSIVHEALEKLYKPCEGKLLSLEFLAEIKKLAKDQLIATFKEQEVNSHTGKNHLIFQVSLQYVLNFIDLDMIRVKTTKTPITLLHVEKELSSEFEFEMEEMGSIPIKLKGKADRIEKQDNVINIIDFKTSLVEKTELNFKSHEDLLSPKKAKAMQVILYSIMYNSNFENEKIAAGIISLRKPSNGFMTYLNKNEGIGSEEIEEGKKVLRNCLFQLLSPHYSFEHNSDSKYCDFCNQ